MHKCICVFALVATLFGLTSCAAMDAKMESWMGHPVSDVIASWGQPDHVFDAGNGNQEFEWSITPPPTGLGIVTTSTENVQACCLDGTIAPPVPLISSPATRLFWVHSNGEIYRWAWHGL